MLGVGGRGDHAPTPRTKEYWIGWRGTRGYLLKYSRRRSIEDIAYKASEVEFLEEIQTEVLRVFLLVIHRHLY